MSCSSEFILRYACINCNPERTNHYFIDTNLIVRCITGHPEKQAALTAQFFQKSDSGQKNN